VQLLCVTDGAVREVAGRLGTVESTRTRFRALVRSPTAWRRQSLRFGTGVPKRVSRKRRVEVWSKVSVATRPPRLIGESTSIGTRSPRPIGPAIAWASDGSGLTVRYSPGVPAAGTGGAGGCSVSTSGASTHETRGSVPAAQSIWNCPGAATVGGRVGVTR
jgi:hypothetical protein